MLHHLHRLRKPRNNLLHSSQVQFNHSSTFSTIHNCRNLNSPTMHLREGKLVAFLLLQPHNMPPHLNRTPILSRLRHSQRYHKGHSEMTSILSRKLKSTPSGPSRP